MEQLESVYLMAGDAGDVITTQDVTGQVSSNTGREISPQYEVNHPPRIQLGNAPLVGFEGSEHDQIDILWQTKSAGDGDEDWFAVAYRKQGEEVWMFSNSIFQQELDFQTRINHQAEIRGLDFDTQYEYRVQHLRGELVIETFQAEFNTRLPPGDPTPFSFAAYGDSAYRFNVENFRQVQGQINEQDPDLVLLLGDNAYNYGAQNDYDARFDPLVSPEATGWIASHIDYLSVGNHDGSGSRWLNSSVNYAVPIPEAGITSPFAPNIRPRETAYSFDYGDVHFLTFNSNYYVSPILLNEQMNYAVADLAASDAKWKVVFTHHPVAGDTERRQHPSDDYFNTVVPHLEAAGVDLLVVGHSHVFSWTYPMLGQSGGKVVFVPDLDKDYDKGTGLVQVISGVGGKSLRGGRFEDMPFTAAGFSTSTTPQLEFGYADIQVTPEQLIVSYIAADDGEVIDRFTITDRPQQKSQIKGVYVKGTDWSPEHLELMQDQQPNGRQLGYEITKGFGQTEPLPWVSIDQITIAFNRDVDVRSTSLVVRDLYSGQIYAIEENGFQYSPATRTATWRLREPLNSGSLVLELLDESIAVAHDDDQDDDEPLRHEYFPFAVLRGDINQDRSVTADDVNLMIDNLGERTWRDLNGNSMWDESDIELFIDILRPMPGDANLDGQVDFSDFLILSRFFGSGSRWTEGDFDSDDDVDFADLLALAANFGREPRASI